MGSTVVGQEDADFETIPEGTATDEFKAAKAEHLFKLLDGKFSRCGVVVMTARSRLNRSALTVLQPSQDVTY